MPGNATRVWVERALLALGIGCLGYYGYMTVEARNFQREQAAGIKALLESTTAAVAPVAPVSLAPGTIALVEIPRLEVSAPVISGDGEKVLSVAVGHLADTPMPWEPGNTAFAAHRDGLFRPLKDIQIGDDIRVRTMHGEFAYRVRTTKIVNPDDLSVLAPTSANTLTLITCYPFYFVGHAPQRFVVQAERTSQSSYTQFPDRVPATKFHRVRTTKKIRGGVKSAHVKKTPSRHSTAASVRHAQLASSRVARGQRVPSSQRSARGSEDRRNHRSAPKRR